MKKFVWANKKGGVGKTTGSSNLTGAFAQAGYRVLAIDMDPQANLTYVFLGLRTPEISVYDLMTDTDNSISTKDAIVSTPIEGIDILPSHKVAMDGAERELSGVIGEQVLLASRLRELAPDEYDFVVIDSPPNLGILTVNAITSADEVIIPVRPGIFALQGIEDLFSIIKLVQTRLNRPDLKVAGFVINEVDHTNVAKDVQGELKKQFGSAVFDTQIPKNVSLEEAHSRLGTVFQHAPRSKGAQAYMELVQEIIKHGH